MTLRIYEPNKLAETKHENGCVLKSVSPHCSDPFRCPKITEKRCSVPLEEALEIVGVGKYTYYVMFVTGFTGIAGTYGMQLMSIIIPAAGCDLQLSSLKKGVLASMPFAGMTLSSFLIGCLADIYGRRKVMIISCLLNAVLSAANSFSPNDITLMVISFFNGFAVAGILTPAFVYISEFCPLKIRAKGILIPYGISTLTSIYLPCTAWLIFPLDIRIQLMEGLVYSSWRFYLLITSVPLLLLAALLLYLLPESPKFVLNAGKSSETLQILTAMYIRNQNKNATDFPVLTVCLDEVDQIRKAQSNNSASSFVGFFRNVIEQLGVILRPPLVLYTAASCLLLFGAIGSFNTVFIWYPEQLRILKDNFDTNLNDTSTLCDITHNSDNNMSKRSTKCDVNNDIFLISICTGLIQSIFCTLVSFTADKIGRRNLVTWFSGISAVLCISIIFLRYFYLTVASLSLMAILLSTTFPIGFSIAVDFFPTTLRSTATSLMMLFGRLGAAGGSQIFGALFQSECEIAYWGMTLVLVVTALIATFLPSKKIPT